MVATRFVLLLAALAASFAYTTLASAQPEPGRVELLDFHYPGCGPCRSMEPTVARLEAEGLRVKRIDGSREVGLATQLRVQSYPTFVAVVDGREVGRIVGATSYDELRRMLAEATPPASQLQRVNQTFAKTSGRDDQLATVGGDWGAGQPAPPRPRTGAGSDQARLINSSVRLTLIDPQGRSYGTGTIIDAREGEALIVTCAHLFRGPDQRPIETDGRLSIELFDATTGVVQVVERVEGQLVSHDFDADVALVAIRPTGVVKTAPILRSPGDLQKGEPVRSVGCDLGEDPTVRTGQVVDLNRYQGPANVEVSGAPVQGRSGGGLFNRNGRLVGVCFAADEEANEGLYAGIASVHAQLDRLGMSGLYRGVTAPAPPAADTFAQASAPAAPPADVQPIERRPLVRGQNAIAPPVAAMADVSLTPGEQATLGEIAKRAERSAVTIVIQPKAGGAPEVLTLDTASPEFVATLKRIGASR